MPVPDFNPFYNFSAFKSYSQADIDAAKRKTAIEIFTLVDSFICHSGKRTTGIIIDTQVWNDFKNQFGIDQEDK